MKPPKWGLWVLAWLFPKAWDRAVHRVATERGMTPDEVITQLKAP